MKLGISIKIDVTKIDKSRLFKGEKGTYLDLTTMIDLDELDQCGNNGFIAQSVSKEERQNGVKTPILGNAKVFWRDESGQQQSNQRQQPAPAQGSQNQGGGNPQNFDDDIPFAPVGKQYRALLNCM